MNLKKALRIMILLNLFFVKNAKLFGITDMKKKY